MLTGLKLWNFSSGSLPAEELCGSTFILRTCQRTLVLTFERYPFQHLNLPNHELHLGTDAYLFLLETICGLKSKLIGENEIVGQFKEAYKSYSVATLKDNKLLLILEKLFKDAKDIRTQYLIGISQKTYASLTRKHFQKVHAKHIVVLGSGQLAEDLINQFKKKAQVSVCGRNTARVNELARLHQINIIPWEEKEKLLVREAFLANTIGHNSIIWDESFFKSWASHHNHRLFVDLGSPSVIQTELNLSEGVVRLDDVFSEGAIVEEQKQLQIGLAREAMLNTTLRRKALFEQKLNRTNELLTPQITSGVRYL